MISKEDSKTVTFMLGDLIIEYDEWKNEYNIEHHGISFRHAARVFLTMTELNNMTKRIAVAKTVMIR